MADPSPESATAHWSTLVEGLQASPLDFYQHVNDAVTKRSIPDTVVERVEYREGGALSRVRMYLRIRRRNEVFDVCGAPFGNGFFFSWWFAELEPSIPSLASIVIVFVYLAVLGFFMQFFGAFRGPIVLLLLVPLALFVMSRMGNPDADDAILRLPLLGGLYARFFRPITYYRIDTSQMFQQAVQAAVKEVVDQVITGGGMRPLTELEHKPIMKNFFKR